MSSRPPASSITASAGRNPKGFHASIAGKPALPRYTKGVALDRSQRAKNDLDWLPPSFKAVRWAVAGTVWTGITGALVALIAVAKHGFWFYGKGFALLFAGGYYAGDQAARAVLRRRLKALAHGDVELGKLAQEPDGELVHVRGVVRAREQIAAVLSPRQAVLHRVVFSVGGERWVHESGHDFLLRVADGEDVLIEVSEARIVAPEPKRKKVEGELARAVFELSLEPQYRNIAPDDIMHVSRTDKGAVLAGEVVICEGDEVEIVGYKSRSIDPTVAIRMERDTPERVTLRAGKALPLLIAPTGKPGQKPA